MEAGERWILSDVSSKPIRAWDSRGHTFRTEHDRLRRPVRAFAKGTDAADPNGEILHEKTEYGEDQPNDLALNLRTRVFRQGDSAGVVTHSAFNPSTGRDEAYDFKGNLLRARRQLAANYKGTLDWSAAVALEPQTYESSTRYDALNRPVELTAPDKSRIRPNFNEANLLESIDVHLGGSAVTTAFVKNVAYNARGQRELIEYGNGAATTSSYDPLTFRLTRRRTGRGALADSLQDLQYTYDAAGNITHLRDDAQQTHYFNNQVVEPTADYTYDALYRLIEATGREHLGQTGGVAGAPVAASWTDAPRVGLTHPNDGQAMGRYLQRYLYDEVGNLLEMAHRGTDPLHPGWTRSYQYNETSQLEPGRKSNRLSSTQIGDDPTETFAHDVHGNMVQMPHLPLMRWDYRDRLRASSKQAVNNGGTPELTYYVYDASGQRVRKVTERQAAPGAMPIRKAERIYLAGVEIYREYDGDGSTVTLERETLHVMDDKRPVAFVETRTLGNDGSPAQLVRYQLDNHLGSACLELDGSPQAAIISYEEYYPYGSTSYQAARNATDAPKRYRYTGKERDDESGLYYHEARYYAPWLGRWTAADPAGLVDGPAVYVYAADNPSRFTDPNGREIPKPQSAQDRTIMMMADPKLHAHMNAMPDAERTAFLEGATGLFQVRARAMQTKYGMNLAYTFPEEKIEGKPPASKPKTLNMTKERGADVVTMTLPEPFVVLRPSGKTFTDAAVSHDTPKTTEFVINGALFDKPFASGVSGPADASSVVSQGQTVERGTVVEGRSSSGTFHFAWSGKGSLDPSDDWSFGKGDPPSAAAVAFGGGKPVVLGGLPYGPVNQYTSGAPGGLPERGDPGESNRKYLTQRSNDGFKELEAKSRSTGLVVMGIDPGKDLLFIVVQAHGAIPGMKLSEIRDYLVKAGVKDALAWDGSDSATLVQDSTVLIQPGSVKNNNIRSGIGVRLR
jgi:RHS repeat-associated protein